MRSSTRRRTLRLFFGGRLVAKLSRYAAVSAISTSVTLSLLGAMIYTRTLSPGWANVVATAAGTVPSFELNRRWVWAKRGRRSLVKEVAPFCTLSFCELALSTVAVSLTARWSAGSGLPNAAVTVISQAANVSTFGALWALQYVLLDRALFGRRPGPQGDAAVDLGGPQRKSVDGLLSQRGTKDPTPARWAGLAERAHLAAAGPLRQDQRVAS